MPSAVGSSTRLQRALSDLSFGLVAGILVAFLQISFAALIFSGPLEAFGRQGCGVLLFGALIMSLVTAALSSAAIIVVHPQDAPAALLSVVAAGLAVNMADAPPEQLFATVVGTIVLSSLITGLCYWLLGRFRLGQLVRFIPYPVSGGFLAGTGWLLVKGGIGVTTDTPIGRALLQPDILLRWAPALLFAVMVQQVLRRYSHFLLLPGLLVSGIGLFYLVYFFATGSIATAGEDGWLLGPFSSGSMWQPLAGLTAFQADWGAIARSAISISAIVLISIISLLLNTTGIEITSGQDIDLNQELRAAGVGNLLAGLVGCPAGYQALGLSTLGYRLRVQSRLGGVIIALFLGLVLALGAGILSTFPRMIAGGFLIFLGLSFLTDWLYEPWSKLPKLDYLLIWVILIAIATVGFLEGVAIGILIAALLFLVNYSRTDIVRLATTRTHYTSSTVRAPLYEQLLSQRGDRLLIVTLQGYIFFGTAHRLVQRIVGRLANDDLPPLRFLVLDFRLVTGIDSSAGFSLTRLKQQTGGVTVVVTGLHSEIYPQLRVNVEDKADPWRAFTTLADGVAWCEEQMIEAFADVGLTDAPQSILGQMREHLAERTDWLDYLKPGTEPAPPQAFLDFMGYLDQVAFTARDEVLPPEDWGETLYFLEAGRVALSSDIPDAPAETMVAGTLLGADAFYGDETVPLQGIALSNGTLYRLPKANLQRMEVQHPQLAILLHRLLAAQMSQRASRAQAIARTLQQ